MIRTIFMLCCVLLSTEMALADEGAKTFDINECLGRDTPLAMFVDPNEIRLRPVRTIDLDDEFVFVRGALGWHTTWGVLFDLSSDPPSAFETYDREGYMAGAFGRMEVPELISTALTDCGFSWQGLWGGDWPDQRHSGVPEEDFIRIPLNELNPPQNQ